MKSDTSRIEDLNEIYVALQDKGISLNKRQYLEQVLDRVLRESKATRQLRDKLVGAVRNGDVQSIKYLQEELIKIRKNEIGLQQDYLNIKL